MYCVSGGGSRWCSWRDSCHGDGGKWWELFRGTEKRVRSYEEPGGAVQRPAIRGKKRQRWHIYLFVYLVTIKHMHMGEIIICGRMQKLIFNIFKLVLYCAKVPCIQTNIFARMKNNASPQQDFYLCSELEKNVLFIHLKTAYLLHSSHSFTSVSVVFLLALLHIFPVNVTL